MRSVMFAGTFPRWPLRERGRDRHLDDLGRQDAVQVDQGLEDDARRLGRLAGVRAASAGSRRACRSSGRRGAPRPGPGSPRGRAACSGGSVTAAPATARAGPAAAAGAGGGGGSMTPMIWTSCSSSGSLMLSGLMPETTVTEPSASTWTTGNASPRRLMIRSTVSPTSSRLPTPVSSLTEIVMARRPGRHRQRHGAVLEVAGVDLGAGDDRLARGLADRLRRIPVGVAVATFTGERLGR